MKRKLTAWTAVLLFSGVLQAAAESTHFGGGAAYTYFNNGHPSMTSGLVPVYQVMAGSKKGISGTDFIISWASFPGSGGEVDGYYYPAEEIKYFATDVLLTIYFDDVVQKKTVPWFSVGSGVNFFGLEGGYYPTYGFQFVAAVGLDFRLSKAAFIRSGLSASLYSTEDILLGEHHSGLTAGLSVAMLFSFDKKDLKKAEGET